MTIFNDSYYQGREVSTAQVAAYAQALDTAIRGCADSTSRETLLRGEIAAVTRSIIDGIQDVIKHNRTIRNLVLNQGAIPLGTWTCYLDELTKRSLPEVRAKLDEMRRELEEGKISGFPGTMFLFNKPTFVTFEDFYEAIFDSADAETCA
jgi:hypothetical protein